MEAPVVQIVENHAEVIGDLLAVEEDTARPGFVTLRVAVHQANDIGGAPNFFTYDVGQTIAMTARRGSPIATRPIGPIRLRAKKTGPGMSFAEDDLPPGG